MRYRSSGCKLLAGLSVLTLTVPAVAQRHVRYTVTDLGVLPGKLSSIPFGTHSINQRGQIVGHCNNGSLTVGYTGDYFTGNVAFLWSKQAGMQALPLLPGAAYATGYTLNDRGQIIGMAGNNWLDQHVVLWEGGTARDLGVLPGDNASFSQAINNHGQIVGQSYLNVTPDGSIAVRDRPFFWQGGQMSQLPMGNYIGGQANDINEKEQIVGYLYRGFFSLADAILWDKGAMMKLPSLGGDALPWDINDCGQIAGQAAAPDGALHAVIWDRRALHDYGTLGGTWAALWAMNNRGQAAGDSTTAGDAADHAILIDNGVMYDLNNLIPAASGWVLAGAGGINDRGQISAVGVINGQVRACLLNPTR